MTGEAWRRYLQTYVALRRAVGFAMRPEVHLLQDFVEHLERRGHDVPVAQVAVEWASASTESQHAGRLSIVRGFIRMVRAAEPGINVPGAGLVRTSKRPTPRILDPNEIVALMEAARSLGPRGALRPHTVATVIGLLASCGLRAGEAIRLDIDDVDLVGDPPCLQIRRTKFRKSRLVPLHPTTAAALRTYAEQRRVLGYDGLSSAFFVSERGARLHYRALARTFVQLARRLGLRGPVGTRGVSLHKLLTFLDQHRQRKPDALTLDDLDAPVILAFLDHLEENRGNSVQSRNARLTAVRSFVRFAALRTPQSLDLTSRVLAIPRKRAPRRQVHYLTRPEMDAILAGCDRSTHGGRRDHVLLLTLYNTGARVSELVALRCSHVRFGAATVVQLFGKGRKERAVPLWTRTSRSLRQWFDEEGEATPDYAFRNARGDRLTRQGVTHLLDQACQRARERCPSLAMKRVSPHVVRHTTAMHLLQAGVDVATIALWLGHERLETTHHYVEADLQLKERALRKLEPLGQRTQRFKADASLLSFLASL